MKSGKRPELIYQGHGDPYHKEDYMRELISRVPTLNQIYTPPPVWGYNGHIQTAVFSLMEKRPGLPPLTNPKRHYVKLQDGSEVTYDVFSSEKSKNSRGADVTLIVCPGINNSSQNGYIRAFAYHALCEGYRVAVLNPLGTIREIPLSTPRLFNFGSTEEIHAVVMNVLRIFSNTRLIAIGFSLGGNIVCKYLGENAEHQRPFIACLSLCQGYDFLKMKTTMNTFKNMRKLYVRVLTDTVKRLILDHQHILLAEENQHRYDRPITARDIIDCELMDEIDELVTIKHTGHKTAESYYEWASSANYLANIQIPIMFLNAKDDPLFPKAQLEAPRIHAVNNPKSLFVLTTHGGHVGFFTKTGRRKIDAKTWLEKMTVEYLNAVVSLELGIPWNVTAASRIPNLWGIPVSTSEAVICSTQNDSQDDELTRLFHTLPNSQSTPLFKIQDVMNDGEATLHQSRRCSERRDSFYEAIERARAATIFVLGNDDEMTLGNKTHNVDLHAPFREHDSGKCQKRSSSVSVFESTV